MGMITFREKFSNEDTRMYRLRKLEFYQKQLTDVEHALDQNESYIQRCKAEIEATKVAKEKLVAQRDVLKLMRRNAVVQAIAALVSFVAIVAYVIWRTW